MIKLTALQCRIIGVMLEKEITTPEQYPLSLNGLTNGCNQKSNRDPVLSLDEDEVQNVLDQLIASKQVMLDNGAGRVNKYKHRFCNSSFGSLQLSEQQKALICVLFLRGPQTPGELRTRTNRLAAFVDVGEVEVVLEQLQHLDNTSLVIKLPREAGKRESRFSHLFSDMTEVQESIAEPREHSPAKTTDLSNNEDLILRVGQLEKEVEALKLMINNLAAKIE